MVFGSVLPQRHRGMDNDYNNFPPHSSLGPDPGGLCRDDRIWDVRNRSGSKRDRVRLQWQVNGVNATDSGRI